MKNQPIVIFAGLAVAAVVAVVGVTKNQWAPVSPETATSEVVSTGEQATVQKPAAETAVGPSFDTVRIEKTGEAVIAGRAEPGSEVTVMLNGKVIGKTVANADGAFVLTPDSALPAGSGALTAESRKSPEAAALKSGETVAVVVPEETKKEALVAVVSPDEPTKILQKSEPATAEESSATTEGAAAIPLSLDAVDYDESGNIVFSGSAKPGSTVRLYVDNAVIGDAKAGEDGRWTFAGSSPIGAGQHMLRVDGIDAADVVVSRVELPFVREESTKVASATAEQTVEPAAATTVDAAKPKDGRVVIQPGNNLWRISRVIYGSGIKFTVIYESNKDQIRDPDLIFPGQVFKTPDVVPPEMIDPARRDSLKPEEGGTAG
ncbi:MAG: Ig-like domain-containing protein [Aestuariivirga sp.]